VSDLTPIQRAHLLGTMNVLDRSKQYPLDDPEKLKAAINQAWTKIHHCEQELRHKDIVLGQLKTQLSRYRIVNIALTSILTGLAWEGVKVLFSHLFP